LYVSARLSAPAANWCSACGKALKGVHWHWRAAGTITGDIRVGGFPKEQHTFARVMGYVEQTDIHSPMVQAWRSLRRYPGEMCDVCSLKSLLWIFRSFISSECFQRSTHAHCA